MFIAVSIVFIAAKEEEVAPEVEEVEEAEPMVGGDELDPWISKLWDEVEEYRHPIPPECNPACIKGGTRSKIHYRGISSRRRAKPERYGFQIRCCKVVNFHRVRA